VAQAPVVAGDRHDEDDGVRQREVEGAGDDDGRPKAGLFRADYGVKVNQPHVAGARRA